MDESPTPLRALVVVLDASGSMYSRRESTVVAVNKLLLEEMRANLDPRTPLHIYTFNTHWHTLRDTTLGAYQAITDAEYDTDGETALYDVLCDLIEKHTEDAHETGTTFVVVSDGRDVASTREDKESVQRNVEFARAHQWCSFLFIGEGLDAEETGLSIGVKPKDMFLTRDCLGGVLASQEVSEALSQSMMMSPDLVPPFLPQKRTKREVSELPGSQVADL